MLGGGREGQAFSPPRYHLQHPRSFASGETGPRYAQGVGAHSVFWSDFRPDRSVCAVIASEAKQSRGTWSAPRLLDCFVAPLLAITNGAGQPLNSRIGASHAPP